MKLSIAQGAMKGLAGNALQITLTTLRNRDIPDVVLFDDYVKLSTCLKGQMRGMRFTKGIQPSIEPYKKSIV